MKSFIVESIMVSVVILIIAYIIKSMVMLYFIFPSILLIIVFSIYKEMKKNEEMPEQGMY